MRQLYKIGCLGMAVVMLVGMTACKVNSGAKPEEKKAEAPTAVQIPVFSADSAYAFIQKQVDFGPRVPGTPAQNECAAWLAAKMRSFGAQVIVQEAMVKVFDGKSVPMKNIIAQYQPEKSNRILLMAHWDSRPFADQDPDRSVRNTPIAGANDGASGTGVLLEIARCLQKQPTPLGIDLILFDVEDYGAPADREAEGKPEFWCLGSQYWAKNPHTPGYFARFGILFDMVGAPNAEFSQEEVSRNYAQSVVDKVWETGNNLGFGKFFSYQKTNPLIDDHLFVNQIIGIPSIDIIQNDATTESSFGSYWHTQSDNMGNISKETLAAAGKTVVHVIYSEK